MWARFKLFRNQGTATQGWATAQPVCAAVLCGLASLFVHHAQTQVSLYLSCDPKPGTHAVIGGRQG